MQKKNRITMGTVALLLALIILSMAILTNIFARYVTKTDAVIDVGFKRWGITVTPGTGVSNAYSNGDQIVVKSIASVGDGDNLLAPGTSGSLMWFRISGTPEVSYGVDFSGSIDIGRGFAPSGTLTVEDKTLLLMHIIPEKVEKLREELSSTQSFYKTAKYPSDKLEKMVTDLLNGREVNTSYLQNTFNGNTLDAELLNPICENIQSGAYDKEIRTILDSVRIYDETDKAIEYFPIKLRCVAYDVAIVEGETVLTKVDSLTSAPICIKRVDNTAQKDQHYFASSTFDSLEAMESFMNGDFGLNSLLDDPFKLKNNYIDRIYSLEWEWLYHYDTEKEVAAGKTENNREDTAIGDYQTAELDTQLGELMLKYPKLFNITLDMSVVVEQQKEGYPYELYTENGIEKMKFGSYPQSVVTDEDLKTTLNTKAGSTDNWTLYENYHISDGTLAEGRYALGEGGEMRYTDVTLNNGEKYRGVYFTGYRLVDVLDPNKVSGDNANQNDNGYSTNTVYWFKYEPITWTIFEKDVDTAYIICDMALDSQEYLNADDLKKGDNSRYNISDDAPNGTYANNYAYSTIRKWLNKTFYETAFDDLQRKAIFVTTVKNDAVSTGYSENPYAYTDTWDKVFLLSELDAKNIFNNNALKSILTKQATDYAKSQGIYVDEGNVYWWLRSPQIDTPTENGSNLVQSIACDGDLEDTYFTHYVEYGVVPTLKVRIEPVIYRRFTEDGLDKVEFGSYPQSEVTDEALKTTLNSMADNLKWTSYLTSNSKKADERQNEYVHYADASIGGNKYRGVKINKGTEIFWYKYEPIVWIVLEEKDGNALLLSEKLLDKKKYQDAYNSLGETLPSNSNLYYSNWEYSTIREWLNDAFYETAFRKLQGSIVAVDNSNKSDTTKSNNNTYAKDTQGNDLPPTRDKVFLLPYKAYTKYLDRDTVTEGTYGKFLKTLFLENDDDNTAYSSKIYPDTRWSTRSPESATGVTVMSYYKTSGNRWYMNGVGVNTMIGVRPTLWLKL